MQKKIDFINELDAYKKSESHQFFLFLRENRTINSILIGNYCELNKILKYHNDEAIVKKFWDSDNNFRFKLQKNISRHLSNYLSSLFAVVDYSRSTLRKYLEKNPHIQNKYDLKKNDFLLNNNRHTFIKDLRNYTSHKSYIKIGSQFSYNIEWSEPRKTIFIVKNELLKWDGWKSESIEFINQSEDKIHLNEIIKVHFEEFIHFQNWIFLQILLVDLTMTKQFIKDIKSIYTKAEENKMQQLLLFKKSYLRYINYLFLKSNSI